MKRAKFHVGRLFTKRIIEGAEVTDNGKMEVFKSVETPTQTSHGHRYGYSIGPFRTKRAAEWMRDNPMCRSVWEAEDATKAKKEAKK